MVVYLCLQLEEIQRRQTKTIILKDNDGKPAIDSVSGKPMKLTQALDHTSPMAPRTPSLQLKFHRTDHHEQSRNY